MAATQGIGLGFNKAKLERRRPSKRQTTLRTFSIVRNWESKEEKPVQTPIKEDANEQELVRSPVFPPPSSVRRSLEVPLTSDSDSAVNSLAETTSSVSIQPGEENIDTNNSPATSIIVDEATPLSMTVPATPESHVQVALQVPMGISPCEPVPDYQDTRSSTTTAATVIDSQSPRVTRGRKRKQDRVLSEEKMHKKDEDEDDGDGDDDVLEYSGNNFVRIFNADQGRKVTMGEITALDVALTAIEELALEYREEVDSDVARQSIKDFFIHVRKSFCECIDLQKDYQTLKSDNRKINSRIKKLRGELLDVQKRRTRVRGELEESEKEENERAKNNQDLLDINEYLHQVENLHKSCKTISGESDIQDKSLPYNLPSLLSETHVQLKSLSGLKFLNSSLQQLLDI